MEVDTEDTLGNALASQGVYDIVTTEVIWRLTEPGDMAIDVGANIGYFTSLLAVRVGKTGEVLAFEPHPRTAALLTRNAGRIQKDTRSGRIVVHVTALSNSDGEALLDVFPNQEQNTSYAFLNFRSNHKGIVVKAARLERFLTCSKHVGVMKIDAQWHEAAVLEGAGEHLRSQKIRDIVFEEEVPFPAPSHGILMDAGYTIFWFEEHFRGPVLIPPGSQTRRRRPYDVVPSYLATLDPRRAEGLFSLPGWNCLKNRADF
jgi:FkbM family methyltransferase